MSPLLSLRALKPHEKMSPTLEEDRVQSRPSFHGSLHAQVGGLLPLAC